MICVSSFAVAALKEQDKSEVQSSHTPAENMVGGVAGHASFIPSLNRRSAEICCAWLLDVCEGRKEAGPVETVLVALWAFVGAPSRAAATADGKKELNVQATA
jgi:hypothetical protein